MLGIVHAEIWTREAGRVADRKKRPIEEKESQRWLNATPATAARGRPAT